MTSFSKSPPTECGVYRIKGHTTPKEKVDLIEVVLVEDRLFVVRPQRLKFLSFFVDECGGDVMWSAPLVDATEVTEALRAIVRDLEIRSDFKRGVEKGIVDVGQGVYFTALKALGRNQ